MAYYKGLNEYRWSYITSTQGHYPLHKNLETAIKSIKKIVNKKTIKEPIVVQLWKPKRGKYVYIVLPKLMKSWSKNTIISYYKDNDYDVSYIKSSKYKIKR